MKIDIILFSMIPASASAWRLQLYDGEGYTNIIEDRSGTFTQPCKTLVTDKINRVQSMHWNNDGLGFRKCNVRLWDDNHCQGTKIADAQYGNWNLPAFSAKNKNKMNSYKIDC